MRHEDILRQHGFDSDDALLLRLVRSVHNEALMQASCRVATIGETVNGCQRISPACNDCVEAIRELMK